MKRILFLVTLLLVTLTACSGSPEYTISFDTGGGTEITDIVLQEEEELSLPDNPSKEGFQFVGWYLDEEFELSYTEDTVITSSLTLYAKWIDLSDTIAVTFYDGTTVLEVIEVIDFDLPRTPDTTKEGYTFNGWYYDEEFTSAYVDGEALYDSLPLYGKWTPVSNYLYFVFEEFALGRIAIEFQEEFILEDIELKGFTFIGWYSDPELTIPVTSIIGIDERMYVYGKYTQEVMNFPVETDLDLSTLGYYSYLDSTNPVIHIHVRDIGTLSLQLFPDVAKNTVDNMLTYIADGAYTDSTFHRIIADFMIQGGIIDTTACPIVGEFSGNAVVNNVSHTRGALSMARTNVMNSATSQFFIVHEDSLFLDGSYATFGGLVGGFNVLDYIATLTTSNTDAPIRDVIIDSVTIDYNGYVPGDRICAS